MTHRRCCCNQSTGGQDVGCLATVTDIPQSQWPRTIYTCTVDASLPSYWCIGGCPSPCNGSSCDQERSCSPGRQQYFMWNYWCCTDLANTDCDGYRWVKESVTAQPSSAYFEFDSIGKTDLDPNRSCTRFIPASVNLQGLAEQCGQYEDTVYWYTEYSGVRTCAQRISDCSANPPTRDSTCADVCEIALSFFGAMTFRTVVDDCGGNSNNVCQPFAVVVNAIYQRAKSHSDTHIAVGEYQCVWSSLEPDGYAVSYPCVNFGCGAGGSLGAAPSTITIGIKT